MSCLKNYKVIIDHSKTDGSIVWNYFGELSDNMGIIQPDKYFCAECLKNEQNKDKQFLKNLKCYSKSSSTGNLKAHLIERHKLSFTPKTPSKSDISKWFTSSPRTPILRKSDPELAESIFLMCARDLLPFQFVEKEGFKDFTNKYLPNRSLPTRQTIVRAGARVTEQIKEYIVDYLASENNIFGTGTGNFTALEVSSFKIEVDKFMMMPLSAETLLLDTLDWWKSHQAEYPMMSILVRSLYSVPSTAAAIERVWSSSGLTISSRRSCLGPTNFENLIFVHENYAFVKSDNSNF